MTEEIYGQTRPTVMKTKIEEVPAKPVFKADLPGAEDTYATKVGYNEWVRRAVVANPQPLAYYAGGLKKAVADVDAMLQLNGTGDYAHKVAVARKLGAALYNLTAIAVVLGFSLGGTMTLNVEDHTPKADTGDDR